jgi:hypothetical protein
MSIFLSIMLTVGYASVCSFFSALTIGLWYGVYKHISEGLTGLKKRGKYNRVIKVASMITMASVVIAITTINVFFWSRTGDVFRELQCSCK